MRNTVLFPKQIEIEQPKEKKKRKGERKDGRIVRTLTDGRKPDGRPNVKYFYGDTIKEAEAQRDAYKVEMERRKGLRPEYVGILVKDWAIEWKNMYKRNVKESTSIRIDAYIKKINSHIGDLPVEDVMQYHIQDILNTVEGMSASHIHQLRVYVSDIFSKAVANRIIIYNPALGVVAPSGTKGGHRALQAWERDAILDNHNRCLGTLRCTIMILTGMRRGELAALMWSDINMADKTINISRTAEYTANQPIISDVTKTEAGVRSVPMPALVYDVLMATPSTQRTGYVFGAPDEPISKQSWRKCMETLNRWLPTMRGDNPITEPVRTHDCRYTYATGLYDAGVDVKTAQYLLGHKDIKTTMQIYTQLSEERRLEKSADAVKFFDGWGSKKQQEESYSGQN